ncbi:uncharacterized protein LOC123409997 [Hordeum vulgare subsp. vulgare]|uniref:uncharacterized protein LOC123409997 n=1 Tax=Hordeum vulgare subsp. vulgare TaxID=112509 RepID=UPI001D1A5212|nr:uncharacterized protein LOC123409997 [Hordeum vulgare subsp. vulgare]
MDDDDSDAAAASLLRVSSGDGTAPIYDACCTKSAMEAGGPKLDAWGGSPYTPFSRLGVSHGGTRGPQRWRARRLPLQLRAPSRHAAWPRRPSEIAKNLPLAPVKLHYTMPAEDAIKIKEGESGRQPWRDTFESFLYVPMRTVMVSTHTLLLAFYAVPQRPIDDRKLAVASSSSLSPSSRASCRR